MRRKKVKKTVREREREREENTRLQLIKGMLHK